MEKNTAFPRPIPACDFRPAKNYINPPFPTDSLPAACRLPAAPSRCSWGDLAPDPRAL